MSAIRGSRARVKNATVNKTVRLNTFNNFTAEEANIEEKAGLLMFVGTYVYADRYMSRINDHLHFD